MPPEFAARFLNHVITEYYEAQLLPATWTDDKRYEQAHAYALEAESQTIGDYNGWWQAPRQEKEIGELKSPPMILRFMYSRVEYDVVYKAGAAGRATQANQVIKTERRKPIR